MIEQTPWWKGIKFWITFLLAAYAAAAVTWMMLRQEGDSAQTTGAHVDPVDPNDGVSEDAPAHGGLQAPAEGMVAGGVRGDGTRGVDPTPPDDTSLVTLQWRARLGTARRMLAAALRDVHCPDPDGVVLWVRDTLLPDARTLLSSGVAINQEQAACLAELEWSMAALTHRLNHDAGDRIAAGKSDAVEALDKALHEQPLRSVADVVVWLARVGWHAKDRTERVYRVWIAGAGKDDLYARTQLGHTEFQHPVNPDLAFRRHRFIRTVERANEKRWFTPDDDQALMLARSAAKRLDAHMQQLLTDASLRAVENVKANLYESTGLRGLHMVTHWADPVLVCFLSPDDLGPDTRVGFSTLTRDNEHATRAQRDAIGVRMQRRGRLYQAVYSEFVRRWSKDLGLRPLMSAFGGRPDYPVSVRSYADGCPLVVLLFDHRLKERIEHVRAVPHLVRVAYDYSDGRVMALENIAAKRTNVEREWAWRLHSHVAGQLVWNWHVRQRNNWGRPRNRVDPGSAGVISRLTALGNHGTDIGFARHDGQSLLLFQRLMKGLPDRAPRWIPLRELLAFQSHAQLGRWVRTRWRQDGDLAWLLYDVQSRAWAAACLDGGDKTLAIRYRGWLDLLMHGESPVKAFEEAFRIQDEADWADLQKRLDDELDALLRVDPDQWRFDPDQVVVK